MKTRTLWRAFATLTLFALVSSFTFALVGYGFGVSHWGYCVPLALVSPFVVVPWWRLVLDGR